MQEYIKIKHSFNAGDLIVILAGLRKLSKDTGKKIIIYQRLDFAAMYYNDNIISTKDADGQSVCMNKELFERLKPLIEAQEYIESMEVWSGQEVDMDYDLTRESRFIPMPNGDIHSYGEAIFPETSCDLSEQWLSVEKNGDLTVKYKETFLVNITQRYNNPYISFFFLRPYQEHLLFSGTEIEHKEFCKQWDLDLELLVTKDFYELTQIIASCKGGLYNQSLHFHLADAIKAPRVLQICPAFPNTFSTGKNGYHSFRQEGLQYHFNKLLNT